MQVRLVRRWSHWGADRGRQGCKVADDAGGRTLGGRSAASQTPRFIHAVERNVRKDRAASSGKNTLLRKW